MNKKFCSRALSLEEYGYVQVFDEIFCAFEQRLTNHEMNIFFDNECWLDTRLIQYDAPGGQKLDISWHWTAPEYAIGPYFKAAPKVLFWSFTYSFIAIAIGISLFAKQKKPPMDVQGAIEFAYSKSNARKDGTVNVKFSDVAGIDNVLDHLEEVVELLKHPETYGSGSLKVLPPKGILLEGAPGTGKTLVAKAIAGEAGLAFYQMSGAEFIQAIVGVGAARIRDIFRRSRVNKPCIIFIDEIDAIGVTRAEAGVKLNEEREQTLNQLLTEMDGFSPTDGIVMVAATNRADLLDPALLRAGRFDRKITVSKPDVKGREEVLRVHSFKHIISSDVDLKQIARDTPGLSPSDLANLLNEAGLGAIRRTSGSVKNRFEHITKNDIYVALDRIQYGVRKDSLPRDSWISNLVSGSACGEALVAWMLRAQNGGTEKIVKISVITRGRGNSFIHFARFDEDAYLVQTRGKLLDWIKLLCAAKASEEVLYGISTVNTTASMSTGLHVARQVVYHFGLSDLGATLFNDVAKISPGTWRNTSTNKAVANMHYDAYVPLILPGELDPVFETKQKMETTAFLLLNEAYVDAKAILTAYQPALWSLVVILNEKREISGTQLNSVINKHRTI
jgi:ATP-dependent metalloprotease FtsH